MKWLKRFFSRPPRQSIAGRSYRIDSTLYSLDGNRSAELREYDTGKAYILESERGEDGQFVAIHDGAVVGPFASLRAAEKFIVATTWFAGDNAPA